MKFILSLPILFCAIALPALAELTPQDLDKIRLIVKEEVKAEIAPVKQELKADIDAVDQELKADIATVKQELTTEMGAFKQELTAQIAKSEKNIKEYIDIRIESVERRLSMYNWVIYVLMPLLVAGIGAPTAMIAWRNGKDRSLETQVTNLTQEVETLKQQRIVNP